MTQNFRKKGGAGWDMAWQKALNQAFQAPPPLRKGEFLQNMTPLKPHPGDFLLVQFCYIRKRIWIVSLAFFVATLYASLVLSADTLWGISAFTPLLALMMVAETGRSARYEMAELEMATRFSLKSVLLARLGILGLGNLLLLGVLFPVSLLGNQIPPVQAGLYIVTPFLSTTFLCLHIVRRYREQGGIYLCTGVAVCIGLLSYGPRAALPRLPERIPLTSWLLTAVFFSFCIVRQYQNFITRELVHDGYRAEHHK